MKKLLLVITFLTTVTALFAQAPVISSFSPLKGAVGTTVTITGSNFDTVATNNIVYFGSAKAVVTSAIDTQITVTVPAGASYTPISVLNTTAHLTAYSSSKFTVTFARTTTFSKSQFDPVVHISIDETSRSLTFGDLNGDNKPELIVPGKNGLIIYCNTSTGPFSKSSYAKQVTLSSNVESRSTIIADMDNDGKPDIITANNIDNSISIYFNRVTGNNITAGSFLKVTIPYGTINEAPYGLATGDIDSDGKLDLLVQNSNNTISIFKNVYVYGSVQPPFFAPRINLTVSNGFGGGNPAIDDLNGDGKPELIIPRSTGNLLVFVNKTQNGVINYSSFEDYKTFTSRVTQHVSIGDIDGDNKPDVITGIGSTTYVSRNISTAGGEINLAARVAFIGGLITTLADFDGDGKVDVAAFDYNNSDVFITKNKTTSGTIKTQSFEENIVLESGDSPTGLYNSDVNGDGKPDVAVLDLSRSEVIIFINDYKPVPPVITNFSPLSGAKDTTVTITGSNFSGNINDNIVYFGAVKAFVTSATVNQLTVKVPAGATYGPISVLNLSAEMASVSKQAFTPVFPSKYKITQTDIAPKVDLPAGTQPYGIAIGDLDGDGKSDFVATNTASGTISVFHNAYIAGKLANPFPKFDIRVGNGPAYIVISDINNDGKPDIIVANYASNTISVLRNTSVAGALNSASFAAKIDLVTLQNPSSIKVTDIDGDGWFDLLVANSGSNSISVIRNIGNTANITNASFAQRVDIVVGGNPSSITTGDINGDGKPDVITTNYSDNTIAVLRNTSTKGIISAASFAPKVLFATAINPISVTCADVNGDNKPDIIVANNGSNSVSLFTNNAPNDNIPVQSILLSPKIDYATGAQPNCITAADIDGDGLADIVTANAASNNISVLRNEKGAFLPKVDFATGKSPAVVSIADLGDDGKPDIFVTNKNGNSISIFSNAPDMRPPVITSFSPEAGPAGTVVTITGKDFNAEAANNIVYFGGTQAKIISASSTQLNVKVPVSAMAQPISVTDTTKKLTGYSQKSFKPTFEATNFKLAKAYDIPATYLTEELTVADLNTDGKPDIILNVGDVLENKIAGPDSSQHFINNIGMFKQSSGKPAAADLNGDGKLDVVTALGSKLSVLENVSDGGKITSSSFMSHTYNAYLLADAATLIQGVCDIDMDGRPDIITLNPAANLFSVHKNSGVNGVINDETFATRTDIKTDINLAPDYLKIGDIDGDGKPDIVVFNNNLTLSSPGTISIYRNKTVTGVPTTDYFEPSVDIPAWLPFGELIDVNGDGKLDIVFVRSAPGENSRRVLSFLINVGNKGTITKSTFMPEVAFNMNNTVDLFSFKDITGNGRLDMLLPMGDISIFQNLLDTRSTANPVILKADPSKSYTTVEVCDMDGDGKPDLIASGDDLGKVVIYKNVSDTVQAPSLVLSKQNAQTAIAIYPNPSVSYSNLEYNLTEQSDVAIKVFDKNGRTVRSYDLKKQTKGLNRLVVQTGDLDKGMYIINLSANGHTETVKLLKE